MVCMRQTSYSSLEIVIVQHLNDAQLVAGFRNLLLFSKAGTRSPFHGPDNCGDQTNRGAAFDVEVKWC